MNIERREVNGTWEQFTLTNNQGMKVSILNYGGIITEILVPDQHGKFENVVLGYRNLQDYETNPNFFGTLVGRVAGRIQDSSFLLDGKTYQLEKNEGKNHLHGGSNGLHQTVFTVETFESEKEIGLKLFHTSPDGEGGYPGTIQLTVTYIVTNDNQLIIDYQATTDQTTALTMTNHAYFNLSGDLKDTVRQHEVTLDSSKVVELGTGLIPTGNILDVEDTTFDFRDGRKIMTGIESASAQNVLVGNGYDHYFLFDFKKTDQAVIKEPNSGRVMTIKTNQPGVVMYTANGLAEGLELIGGQSEQYAGVCFETQASPASLHHEGFPSVVLNAGETYSKQTIFTFFTEE